MKKFVYLFLYSIIVSSLPSKENKAFKALSLLNGLESCMIERIWNIIKEYTDKAITFLKEIGF